MTFSTENASENKWLLTVDNLNRIWTEKHFQNKVFEVFFLDGKTQYKAKSCSLSDANQIVFEDVNRNPLHKTWFLHLIRDRDDPCLESARDTIMTAPQTPSPAQTAQPTRACPLVGLDPLTNRGHEIQYKQQSPSQTTTVLAFDHNLHPSFPFNDCVHLLELPLGPSTLHLKTLSILSCQTFTISSMCFVSCSKKIVLRCCCSGVNCQAGFKLSFRGLQGFHVPSENHPDFLLFGFFSVPRYTVFHWLGPFPTHD